MINIEEHKVYVDSLKMEMIPYSIAVQAIKQAGSVEIEKYMRDLEHATSELHKALNQLGNDN